MTTGTQPNENGPLGWKDSKTNWIGREMSFVDHDVSLTVARALEQSTWQQLSSPGSWKHGPHRFEDRQALTSVS